MNPSQGQAPQDPLPCIKGCGFFGRENTGGMCSKCYKESMSQQQSAPAPASASSASSAPSSSSPFSSAPLSPLMSSSSGAPTSPSKTLAEAVEALDFQSSASSSTGATANPPASPAAGPVSSAAASAPAPASPSSSDDAGRKRKVQADRTRCMKCRKKVGLTGIECRCGFVYCGTHRYAEEHDCTFDFKTFGRANIAAANEKVVARSLEDKL